MAWLILMTRHTPRIEELRDVLAIMRFFVVHEDVTSPNAFPYRVIKKPWKFEMGRRCQVYFPIIMAAELRDVLAITRFFVVPEDPKI